MTRRRLAAVRAALGRDSGITLAELVVVALLLGLVVAIAGGLMIQTMRVQEQTTSLNDQSNDAQAVMSSIELAVRNASETKVQNVPGGDQILIVKRRSTTATGTPVCSAWYFDVSERQIRTVTDKATGTPRSAAAAATPASGLAWPLVLDEVRRVGPSTPVFQGGATLPVTVTFEVDTGDGRPALEVTSVARKRAGAAGLSGASCG